MVIERREQQLYASHHQFYVEDGDAPGNTGDPSFWTEQAFNDKLALVTGIVGIGTGSYGRVRVYSELHDTAPPLDLTAWDHVTEANLEVTSDTVRVIGCLDTEGENFTVKPGTYRVRCCHANLAEADDIDDGEDWYVVQIWRAPISPPAVLKRWADDIE